MNRVVEAASGGRALFPLFFLHRVCSSSQGLLNATMYGLSRGVREAVAKDLHALWPSRFPPPPSEGLEGAGGATAVRAAAATLGAAAGAGVGVGAGSVVSVSAGVAAAPSGGGAGGLSLLQAPQQGEVDLAPLGLPGAAAEDEDVAVEVPQRL